MRTQSNFCCFLLFVFLLTGTAASAQSPYGKYGKDISPDGAVAVSDVATSEEFGEDVIKLEGEIEGTCKMKGCWMKVADGRGGSMRVTFKDYGFFVPKEGMEGKVAVMEGVVEKKTISVDEQRHYAEDAGKSKEEIAAITTPKVELSFVAEGVIIR